MNNFSDMMVTLVQSSTEPWLLEKGYLSVPLYTNTGGNDVNTLCSKLESFFNGVVGTPLWLWVLQFRSIASLQFGHFLMEIKSKHPAHLCKNISLEIDMSVLFGHWALSLGE